MKKNKKRRVDHESLNDNLFNRISQYPIFETIAIFLLYVAIGYLIDPHDICMLNSEVSYMTILLIVVTLFHGLEGGLLLIGLFAVCMWYFYPEFYYVQFLMGMIITLICGEFYYFWNKKIRKYKISSDYQETKLLELSKSFYALKISHDQLEKNYVFKPMSLRNSIRYIKQMSQNEDRYFKEFLSLIENTFQINIATLLYKSRTDKTLQVVAQSEGTQEQGHLNLQDPLVKMSLESKRPVYISDHAKTQSQYIAAIPTVYQDKIEGMLLIEKMPFMSFNKENLIAISIMFDYFFSQIRIQDELDGFTDLEIIEDLSFRLECARLIQMQERYQVNSSALVIKTDDALMGERLYSMICRLLRSLDKVTAVKGPQYYKIVMIFPFANKDMIEGFMKRLLTRFDDIDADDFEQLTFDMSQIELMDKFLRLEHAK
ncbi:PelD GGDEF domain-containing protein [Sulfurospirillum sp. 1612]|uniref:PelD GGDEF domain-containing protein n=1 Tax=Sulfurospirillum sp. 1612 TaxID=3094835 RepID=UPI002F94B544